MSNPNALAIAQKWYAWYFPDWAAMNAGTSVTLQSGWTWWTNQINADGLANAWMNFSNSVQPVADNVAQRAAAYQALGYGAPTDPPPVGTLATTAPPLTEPYTTFLSGPGVAATATAQTAPGVAPLPSPLTTTGPVPITAASATPQQIASATPAQQAAAAAQIGALTSGVSANTWLLLGAAAAVGFVIWNRSRRGSAA